MPDTIVRRPTTVAPRLVLTGLVACGLAGCRIDAVGDARTESRRGEASPEIDSLLAHLMHEYDVPGVGVALVGEGRVLLTRGLGVRSTTHGEPVTAATVFSLGSVSKSFAALLAMRLVEDGVVDLDTPVTRYLPDFRLDDQAAEGAAAGESDDVHPVPGAGVAGRDITLRHLLSHTSGIPRLPEWPLATRAEIVARLATVEPRGEPGSVWDYSNQNYVVAGHALEAAAGESYEDLLRRLVLEPLGVETVSFGPRELRRAVEHAVPHMLRIPDGQMPAPYESHLQAWSPAGAVNASAGDMARYVLFQLGDGAVPGGNEDAPGVAGVIPGARLLAPSSMETMHATAFAGLERERFGAMPVEDPGYAFGWYTSRYRDLDILEHTGTLNGFTASVVLVPSRGAGVALLTNADHALSFTTVAQFELLDRMLGLEPERDLEGWVNERTRFDPVERRARLEAARTYVADPEEWAPLLGRYRSPDPGGPALIVTRSGGRLRLEVEGQLAVELVPFEPLGFLGASPPAPGLAFRFERDGDGTVRIRVEGDLIAIR